MNRYPDFVCIGAQKAGTTWIYHGLRRHSGAFVSFLKETFYLNYRHPCDIPGIPSHREWVEKHVKKRCENLITEANRKSAGAPSDFDKAFLAHVGRIGSRPIDDAWYAELFSIAKPQQLCGELTPDYSLLPTSGIEHLLRLSPFVKVFLICREPIDRDWSQIRMILDTEQRQLEKILTWPHTYERSNYPAIIDRWASLVPPDQFRVYFYDHLKADPRRFLSEFAGFVGLSDGDADWPLVDSKVFEGRARPMPDSVREALRCRHASTIAEMAKRFPDPCVRWLEAWGE